LKIAGALADSKKEKERTANSSFHRENKPQPFKFEIRSKNRILNQFQAIGK